MADVSKIFKPRRGLASTMSGAGKKDIVLAKGEMFVEAPSTGMGTGESKIKIGDGTTAYASLPYALGDTSNNKIEFTSNTSTTVATALNSVASGNALKTIIAGLKQAISLCNTSITQLNDDLNSFQVGVNSIVSAVNSKANTSLTSNSTNEEIIEAINGIKAGSSLSDVKAQGFYSSGNSHSCFSGSGVAYISGARIYSNYKALVSVYIRNTNNGYLYVNGVEKFGTWSGGNYCGGAFLYVNSGDYLYYAAPSGGTPISVLVMIAV